MHIWFPGHTPEKYNATDQTQFEEYKNYYINSMFELKMIVIDIFKFINIYDKDAIIIFMGDHGSALFRNAKVDDLIDNRKISAFDLNQDKREVLLAIYPAKIGEYITNKLNNNNSSYLYRFVLESSDSIPIL